MPPDSTSKRATLKGILNDLVEQNEGAPSSVDSLEDDLSLTTDLGLDSMDLAEMTVRLEDHYGVDVFEDEVIDEVGEVLEKLR